MYKGVNLLCVIPARGGSKGIPGKNLCKINGKSLTRLAIDTALSVNEIDYICLSTDDQDIRQEAANIGLDTNYCRPGELALDNSKSIDVWKHAWQACEKTNKTKYEYSILLEPTSPCRIPADIILCLEKLYSSNFSLIVSVSKTPAHFTPEKTLQLDDKDQLTYFHDNGENYDIRQNIPEYYHRDGICYASKREHIFREKQIITDTTGACVIDRDIVNIDEPLDLQLAELLLSNTENKN